MHDGICVFCGRAVPIVAHGWCDRCYRRWRRHGDPATVLPHGGIRPGSRIRFETKVDRSGGPESCHSWTGSRSASGYGKFGSTKSAHVAAWEFANGPVPVGYELDHECHNQAVREGTCQPGPCAHRLCCNERHLIARTRQEHVASGQPARGSAHGSSRLAETDIPVIRAALASGETLGSIGARYGVHFGTISDIKRGLTWVHVPTTAAG